MPAAVELKAVDSSMFSYVGYSDEMWVLSVVYKSSGLRLDYQNLPPELYDEMMAAESIGKFFNKNIKGQFKAIGEDVAKQAGDAPLEVIDSDIKLVEPGWNGRTIDPVPEVDRVDVFSQHPDGTYTEIKGEAAKEVVAQFGFSEYKNLPPDTRSDKERHQAVVVIGETVSAALTPQTQGEVLPKWSAPDSAAEALDMLAEHKGEIDAIIFQNRETGTQALTIKIATTEARLEASEVLNRLVSKKDQTVALLDPFRAVLYAAYGEAADKVKKGLDPLELAIRHVKNQCLSWDQAQERERQRLIREENQRREEAALALQQAESQRLTLAEVDDKLEQGDEAGAQLLFDAPIQVPKPYIAPEVIPPAAPKVQGQSTTTTWKVDREVIESDETGAAYIASITTFLRAVKDGSYPIETAAPLLSWDFSAADKLAGALMGAFNVPGLSAMPVGTMRVSKPRKRKS